MGNTVMAGALLLSLAVLALLALAKPLRWLLRLGVSAAAGSALLFLGQSLGAAVGVNVWTAAVCAFLGLPGVAGLFLLSFLL